MARSRYDFPVPAPPVMNTFRPLLTASNAFRLVDVDVGQSDATIKSKPFDTSDACRDRYTGKTAAIVKRPDSD